MTYPTDHPTAAPAGTPAAPAKRKRSVSAGQILAAVLLVLVVVFIAENSDDVRIRFIAGPKVSVPVYLALIVAAVVGGLISALLRYRRHRKTTS